MSTELPQRTQSADLQVDSELVATVGCKQCHRIPSLGRTEP